MNYKSDELNEQYKHGMFAHNDSNKYCSNQVAISLIPVCKQRRPLIIRDLPLKNVPRAGIEPAQG